MAKILPPRRDEALVDASGRPTLRFALYLESLADTTNSSVDDIAASESAQTLLSNFVIPTRPVTITAVDYTTSESEIVICTDKVTITLNDAPEDQEVAVIHAANGVVTIDGNSRTINGETAAVIRRQFTTWDIIFVLERNEWVVI